MKIRRLTENSIVVFALIFAIVLGQLAAYFLPSITPPGRNWLGGFLAVSILWAVAYFMPTSETRRFASRESIVAGGCVILYMTLCGLLRFFGANDGLHGDIIRYSVSILITFLCYRCVLRSYRKMHAGKDAEQGVAAEPDRAGG